MDSAYTIEWAKTIGGVGDDYGNKIIETSDGGYAITGNTDGFGAGSNELMAVKLGSTGALEWAACIGGTSDDYGKSLIEKTDGNLIIVGTTDSYGAGDLDAFILELSSTGSMEWAKTLGDNDYDSGYDIVPAGDGFAITGIYKDYPNMGILLAKFDGAGQNCIEAMASPSFLDITDSVATSAASLTEESYIPEIIDTVPAVMDTMPTDTILCHNTGIEEQSIRPVDLAITAHPNPFNSAVAISTPANARVGIFDINGKQVTQIPSGDQAWHPDEEIGSGIYFISAHYGNSEARERIIYLK